MHRSTARSWVGRRPVHGRPFLSLALLLTAALLAASPLLAAGPAADQAPADETTKPPRLAESIAQVGDVRAFELTPDLDRAVESAGGLRWSRVIESAGASFVKLRLSQVDLRPGDVLIVRRADGRTVEEITGNGPKDARSFWTLSAFGDRLELELRFERPYAHPPFRVTHMVAGSVDLFAVQDGEPGHESICAPSDFEDVICYEGDAGKWANVQASVGVMTVGGNASLWCSGSNLSATGHVLTNYHCVPDFAPCSNAEFVFKYYRTGCNNGSPPTADWVSFRCDEIVAFSVDGPCDPTLQALDYSLSTVIGDPAAQFGFVEVDPTPITSGEAIYIVQHPDGRPHEITHGEGEDVVVDGTTFRYYDTLDTEGGSSGSPIFRESDDKLVGLHHCGGCATPGVGNRGMLMSDIYPEISSFLCSSDASLGAVASDAPVEVSGNGDEAIDPGETWSFVPRLRNLACETAVLAVEADLGLASGSIDVEFLDPTTTFGDVAAGAVAEGTPVRFRVSTTAPCGDEATFDLTGITGSGGPFPDILGVLTIDTGTDPVDEIFYEGFADGLPVGWSIVDGGSGSGPAATWTADNPGTRDLLTPPFMIADSDALGTGNSMDEELIMPAMDLTSYPAVSLRLEHNFRDWSGGGPEKGDIDVRSSATGGSWINVFRVEATTAGMIEVDLTPYLANDVQIRFHYWDANFDYWWAIDDIYLLGIQPPQCSLDALFSDDFESGDLTSWSSALP